MNLAHFYSMIQFSGQKGSTSKKTPTATPTATATATATSTNEAATTTMLTKATTTTTSVSLSAPTKTTQITTTASATTNQLPPTVMTAATAAVGYSNGILYLPHDTININNNNNNNNSSNIIGNIINNHVMGDEGHEEDEDDEGENEETDSLASMETLSDNVSIWVDGEKHWVSGVDANTTCRDLINALLNYQDGPQMCSSNNSNNNKGDNIDNIDGIERSNKAGGNSAINQSTLNTKEDEATAAAAGAAVAVVVHEADDAQKHRNADAFSGNDRRTCSNDAAAYVIVRQHRHCEEFLDHNTKVFDLLPAPRDAAGRREHQQLYLRRLTLTSHVASHAPGLGSLLSTDKDSGMGSPVGSSRSARLRRKKHKSTVSWLAQGNTLHPKLSQRGSAANERLLKIILAQDETIHRQLTLLREKERQISKIEEENHRTRERELGKNYLLETYLNGLDEAGTGADVVEGEEIFIDEPFVDYTRTTTTATATKAIKQQQHQQERKSKRSSRHSKQPATQNKKETAAAATRTTTKSVTTAPDTPAPAVAGSQTDLEQQILWMEKLCSINKQLQREEELLLKLHSKIRKHHVKRAYHRKQQMLQQLDDLDSNITLQAVDIRKNEADLAASDEQLQQKVSLLERISLELEADVCAEQKQKQTVLAMATTAIITASPATSTTTTADVDLQQPGYQQLVPPASAATSKAERPTFEEASATAALTIAATEIATATAASASASVATRATTSTSEPRTRFTLDAMQLPEDLLSWQQLIAKPQVLSTTPTTAAATMQTASKAATVAAVAATAVVSAANAATNYEQRINHASNAAQNSSSNVALQLQQRQQHLNDKLHALHMKTVKKQMFSPKAVVSNAPVVGVPAAAAPVCRPPPTQPQPQPQPTLLFLADALDFTQIGTLV